jgi:hypothetical protein
MKNGLYLTMAWIFLGALVFLPLRAQEMRTARLSPDAWKIEARQSEFTTMHGKECLYLENGSAHLLDSDFKMGIIEYEVMFQPGRKFAGIQFRIQDEGNHEEFYMRAHQSGNPDATQYTPVYNGMAGWQLYYGEGYSTACTYKFGEWMPVRLVVAEKAMDVYVEDMSKPLLKVRDLKRDPESGMLGFWTLLGGAWFANLNYQPMEQAPPVPQTLEIRIPPVGTIEQWEVSSAFNAADLAPYYLLDEFPGLAPLEWQTLPVEYSGTVNLAQVSPVTQKTNTVLVKTTLYSDLNQMKRMDFGYSDDARLYVNGQVLYSGQRRFRSRDYRYLGTMGYFDAVYLPLEKGENEVVFAITGGGGGWGLKAKLENLEGISK